MPKSGTFGSGRGVSGNGHPYRDHSGLFPSPLRQANDLFVSESALETDSTNLRLAT
jgi:hypothetical protein